MFKKGQQVVCVNIDFLPDGDRLTLGRTYTITRTSKGPCVIDDSGRELVFMCHRFTPLTKDMQITESISI